MFGFGRRKQEAVVNRSVETPAHEVLNQTANESIQSALTHTDEVLRQQRANRLIVSQLSSNLKSSIKRES